MGKFIKGMDLSTMLELERCGAAYYDGGRKADILDIMKSYDVDTIRIRVWNDPWSETGESYGAGENDVKTSLEIGKRVTAAGFGVLLNLHYSDFWADPGKQFKPKAWASYGMEELERAVYEFTLDTMRTFLGKRRKSYHGAGWKRAFQRAALAGGKGAELREYRTACERRNPRGTKGG